jgi:translation initiation factor IF-1
MLANEKSEIVYKGEFFRLPRGGVIKTGSGEEVFVPEIWVRRLGLEHGDVLSSTPLGKLADSMLYEFTVEERRGMGASSKRVPVTGPVISHGGQWMIYSEEDGELITLRGGEVRAMRLKEGDIVEVAYMKGDPSSARIAWKYDETELPGQAGKMPGKFRDKAGDMPRLDVADPLLTGRTVLVVGADLYKESFKRMFERRGSNFIWESGFQGGPGKTVESKVRRADIVVIVTEMMSHRMPAVEVMCLRHGKPFIYAPSKGSSGAIRQCQKVLAAKNMP